MHNKVKPTLWCYLKMNIASIKPLIEKECSVFAKIIEDHLNILINHRSIQLRDKNPDKYIRRITSTVIEGLSDDKLKHAIETEIESIRTKCILQLSTDVDDHIGRTENLVKSHKRAMKFRDKVPEIFDSRYTERILQERVNCYSRFLAIIDVDKDKLTSIEFEEWERIVENARGEIVNIINLSKEMAKDVAVYRKQLGDDRRERWARWGLLLGVTTAAFGQADNAISNIKKLSIIFYETLKGAYEIFKSFIV